MNKNIYFILCLFICSSSIMCFDDMIAMLPSLKMSLKKKNFLIRQVNNTTSLNYTKNTTQTSLKNQNSLTKHVNSSTSLNLTKNSNKTSLNTRNFLKKHVSNKTSLNLTENSTEKTDCEEMEFYVKIDKEIQNHILRVKSLFVNRSVKLEKMVKSEKNLALKEGYKKKLNEIVNNDIEELKVIEELFQEMQKDTLNMKNEACKKVAVKQLNSTKRSINLFIQTMNGVLLNSGEKIKKVSFL